MNICSRMLTVLAVGLLFSGSADAQNQEYPRCGDDETYGALDFWVGEWRVESNEGDLYGSNRIEKVLDGCGVKEYWTDAEGGTGFSLFYVMEGQWRQVWITPYARLPGGIKEKRQVLEFDGEGIRFQGKITKADGSSYLDRTTLTPMAGGRVRQNIEVSQDEGETWVSGWDAVYVPINSPD